MTHQFKSGDLALIIGSMGRRPELVGTVIVLKRRGVLMGEPFWWWMDGQMEESTAERHLMPLRDDFAPTGQKSKAVPA
ncbi:hypothetical protein ACQKDL_12960 [Pseudomonas bubulae]|uniref:Uncharacterized protein n=1 Tax=Pseudomonas fluorescens TaxID=294 RepID=A0A5E7ADD6_PSEFL|nr:hypothetical protein [Pseudomonas fluorescens]VVN74317.1 hypothetical protein PS710_00642 [Pseudomonas fluorescens]